MREFSIDSVLMKCIGVAGAWFASFFAPIGGYLALVVTLVMADLYTGIKAARKREEVINSKGLRKSIGKISLYFLAIILSRGMEVIFFEGRWINDHIPLTYLVAGFISAVEFQSNIENISAMTGINIWEKIKGKFEGWLKSNDPTNEGK